MEGDAVSRSGVIREGLERGGEHSHVARPAVVCPQLPAKHDAPVTLWGRTSPTHQPAAHHNEAALIQGLAHQEVQLPHQQLAAEQLTPPHLHGKHHGASAGQRWSALVNSHE